MQSNTIDGIINMYQHTGHIGNQVGSLIAILSGNYKGDARYMTWSV